MEVYTVMTNQRVGNLYVESLYKVCTYENIARKYADEFDMRHYIKPCDLYNIVPEEIYVEWVTMMQQYPELVMESYRKYPYEAFIDQKFRVQLYDEQWCKCTIEKTEVKSTFE